MGPQYKPLSANIAEIAAPVEPSKPKPLYCTIGKGAARSGKGWGDFSSANMVLDAGGKSVVTLAGKSGPLINLQGYFDADGQKLIFCPVFSGPPDATIECTSIYALDDDLAMGIKRTFDIPDAVRGGAISCAFDKSHLQKL